jgi:DNA gyrase subunit A
VGDLHEALDEGDRVVSALFVNAGDKIVLISRMGKALRMDSDAVRSMGRQARGVGGMRLADGDELVCALRVDPECSILLITEKGYGKRAAFDNFIEHSRNTFGQRIYLPSEKTGRIAGAVVARDRDKLMCVTASGQSIKAPVSALRVMGRDASGVRVLDIPPDDRVIGVDCVDA